MQPQRKLAAILFSDIAGYTRLMGSDEAKALGILNANRRMHVEYIEQFNGTYIKEIGDGTMASFPTATEAVECALQLSNGVQGYQLRIGIHVGEVILDNKDVFGDGVNIASRIENAGVPGSILLSEKVNDNLSNQPHIKTRYIGHFQLKNDNQPRGIYAVDAAETIVPKPSEIRAPMAGKTATKSFVQQYLPTILVIVALGLLAVWVFRPQSEITSKQPFRPEYTIAVIPFTHEGSTSNERAAAVLAEGVSNQLAGVKDFTTIMSTEVAKGEKRIYGSEVLPDLLENDLAKKLNATHYLKGDIEDGLTVSLFELGQDSAIWEEDYSLPNLWRTINDITTNVALHLGVDEQTIAGRLPPPMSNQTLSMYTDARHYFNRRAADVHNLDTAIHILYDALTVQPNNPELHGMLSLCWAIGTERNLYIFDTTESKILTHAEKALMADSTQSLAHIGLGMYYFRNKNFDKSEEHYELSYRFAPNDGVTVQSISEHKLYTGDYHEALKYARQALKLSPYDPAIRQQLVWSLMANGYVNSSFEKSQQAVDVFGKDADDTFQYKFWNYLIHEKYDSAIILWEPRDKRKPVHDLYQGIAFIEKADSSNALRIMRSVDTSEAIGKRVYGHLQFMNRTCFGDAFEKEEAYAQYDSLMNIGEFSFGYFFQTYPLKSFDVFRSDPRYQTISRKYGIEYERHPYFAMLTEFPE